MDMVIRRNNLAQSNMNNHLVQNQHHLLFRSFGPVVQVIWQPPLLVGKGHSEHWLLDCGASPYDVPSQCLQS